MSEPGEATRGSSGEGPDVGAELSKDVSEGTRAAQAAAPGVWIGPGIFRVAREVEDELAELGEPGDGDVCRTVGELVDLWLRVAKAEAAGQPAHATALLLGCGDPEGDTHKARLVFAAAWVGAIRLTIEAPDIPGVFRCEGRTCPTPCPSNVPRDSSGAEGVA